MSATNYPGPQHLVSGEPDDVSPPPPLALLLYATAQAEQRAHVRAALFGAYGNLPDEGITDDLTRATLRRHAAGLEVMAGMSDPAAAAGALEAAEALTALADGGES